MEHHICVIPSLVPMAEPKTSKRGRRPTDLVDRYRTRVWYWAVKARTEWSDYRLDVEFVRPEGEEKGDGAHRSRSFEGMRRYGRVPSSGNHQSRSYDLVARVDAHPDFVGTAKYFHSPFWALLKANAMNLSEAHAFVSRCMDTSQVLRPSGKFEMGMKMLTAGRPYDSRSFSSQELYLEAIKDIVANRPLDLDLLALVGGLFREAYLACALDIAVILKGVFLELLTEYCRQDWLGALGENLADFAENKLLYWRVDSENLGEELYDTRPAWAIQRPLFSIDDRTRPLLQNQDSLYDDLMADFIDAVWGEE